MSITFRTAKIQDLDAYEEKLVNEKPTFRNISDRITMWLIKGCGVGIFSLPLTFSIKFSFIASVSVATIGSLYDIYCIYANHANLRNHALHELSGLSNAERMQNRFHRIHEILDIPPARKEMIELALQLEKPKDLTSVNIPTGNGEVIYTLDTFLMLLCNILESRDIAALAQTCTGLYYKMRSINSINHQYRQGILGKASILPAQESSGINALAYRSQTSESSNYELFSPRGIARGRDWLLLDGVHGGGRCNTNDALPRMELVDLRENKNFQSVYVESRERSKPDMFSVVLDPNTGWPKKIHFLHSFHGKVQTCDVNVENDCMVTKIVDTVQAGMGAKQNWVEMSNGMFIWTAIFTRNFALLNPQTGKFNILEIELPEGHYIADIQVIPENNLIRWLERNLDNFMQWHVREV